MSDLLSRLAARALGTAPLLSPRPRGRFEDAAGAGGLVEIDVESGARGSLPPPPPRGAAAAAARAGVGPGAAAVGAPAGPEPAAPDRTASTAALSAPAPLSVVRPRANRSAPRATSPAAPAAEAAPVSAPPAGGLPALPARRPAAQPHAPRAEFPTPAHAPIPATVPPPRSAGRDGPFPAALARSRPGRPAPRPGSQAEPVVTVTIGRIEIAAPPTGPPEPSPPAARGPAGPPLDELLDRARR